LSPKSFPANRSPKSFWKIAGNGGDVLRYQRTRQTLCCGRTHHFARRYRVIGSTRTVVTQACAALKRQVMRTHAQLEARLLAVETALQEMQRRLATLPPTPDWLDEIIGSFKDAPAFDEVIALGRAFRESEPYPDDPGAPA